MAHLVSLLCLDLFVLFYYTYLEKYLFPFVLVRVKWEEQNRGIFITEKRLNSLSNGVLFLMLEAIVGREDNNHAGTTG